MSDSDGKRQSSGLSGLLHSATLIPLNLFLSSVGSTYGLVRSHAPQIAPFLIVALLLPVAGFLSAIAGWFVWRSASISWEAPLYMQYGYGSQPYASALIADLGAYQKYDISIHLSVPSTEYNYDLGNFMTSLTLSTADNTTLTTVRRPALVVPPRRLFMLPESQLVEITIPMLEAYASGTSTILANVQLGRNDDWRTLGNGHARELSVFSASIRGNVFHHGIRGLLTRFPLTFSIISAAIFFAVTVAIVAACTLPIVLQESTLSSTPVLPMADDGEEEDRKPEVTDTSRSRSRPRRRRSRRGTESRTRSPPIKSEDDDGVVIPSTLGESSELPLRRRRSRLLGSADEGDS